MNVAKIQSNPDNYKIELFYYNRARDAMWDAVNQLFAKGYKDIFIPGYIGWSPREGSGIFDPLNSIIGLGRNYYKMTGKLEIDVEDLNDCLTDHSILLLVNYFGFRDKNIKSIIELAKARNCVVIEDNAHGFYTFYCNGSVNIDLTFFSLHKMFPFDKGGGLIIENQSLGIVPAENIKEPVSFNPFLYDINSIAKVRINNFKQLYAMMEGHEECFVPLRTLEDIENNIPQTFPICICKGDRNKIYEIMNDRGFGLVSLYHTMIEELRNERHSEACHLSSVITNLPLHQDVDPREYPDMIEALLEACHQTC